MIPIIITIVAVFLLAILIISCYKKTAPTDAIVVSGAFHKTPKIVIGRGVFVLPFIQRFDKISMRLMKLDVKTPNTGVKTNEGVPLWIDSVVTVQVYSDASIITESEWKEDGYTSREQYIAQRQQAAISNFLGQPDLAKYVDEKINDILQGNLREIVAEMTVLDVLTKRKEFAVRVLENAKPDLAKIGLEIVTFNIQDIQDAVDSCGSKHGVVEAIGVQREAEVKREAEKARALAERDIAIAKAEAERETAEKQAEANRLKAEAHQKLELRKAELKAQEDIAKADADAAGQIRMQIQEKTRREAEADVEIAAQNKEIERAAKEAEVRQRQLDAEIRKQAEAEKYRAQQQADAAKYAAEAQAAAEKKKKELDAEAALFEISRQAEAKKIAAEAELIEAQKKADAVKAAGIAEAEAIRAKGIAEAEAIQAKGIAEAEAIEKKAEAQLKMGEASKLEMLYSVLPEIAANLATVLNGASNVTLYGGTDAASNLMSSMTQGLNQFVQSVSDGTGANLDANALAGAVIGAKAVTKVSE